MSRTTMSPASPTAGRKRPVALVYDDNAGIRRLIADACRDAGADAEEVDSAWSVLRLLCRREYDLVIAEDYPLSGFRFPGHHLFGVLERTSAPRRTRTVLTVPLTNIASENAEMMRSARADVHLSKPFMPSEAARIIRQLLDPAERDRWLRLENDLIGAATSWDASSQQLDELWDAATRSARTVQTSVSAMVRGVARAIAANPNVSPELMVTVAAYAPEGLLENPALLPILLADPGLFRRMPTSGAWLVAMPQTPAWLLDALIASQITELAEAARMHVAWAGELESDWRDAALDFASKNSRLRYEIAAPDIVIPGADSDWRDWLVFCLRPGPTATEREEAEKLRLLPDRVVKCFEPYLWPGRIHRAAADPNRLIRAVARGILRGEIIPWERQM